MKITKTVLLPVLFIHCALCVFAGTPEYMNGSWYYRTENGELAKNTFVSIEGTSYYFGMDGTLSSECVIEEGGKKYGIGENGAVIRNAWKKMKNRDGEERWMYFGFDGRTFSDGWLADGGGRYHFTDGTMDWGWLEEENGAVYYLGGADDGKAHTGWMIWKGGDVPGNEKHPQGWYYFSESTGRMIANREISIGDAFYVFTAEGTEASGFCTVEENGIKKEKFYDPTTGKRAAGWLYVDAGAETSAHPEGWYYFLDGIPLRPGFHTVKLSECVGTASVNGNYYAFDANGTMLTGLIHSDNGKDYFFDTTGTMRTGLVCVSDGPATGEYLFFETEGTCPPLLGGTVTGVRNECLYDHGKKITAEKDSFELITIEQEHGKVSYIVARDGTIRRNGRIRLENGKIMRIFSENGSYGWEEQLY